MPTSLSLIFVIPTSVLLQSLDELTDATVPDNIKYNKPLNINQPCGKSNSLIWLTLVNDYLNLWSWAWVFDRLLPLNINKITKYLPTIYIIATKYLIFPRTDALWSLGFFPQHQGLRQKWAKTKYYTFGCRAKGDRNLLQRRGRF